MSNLFQNDLHDIFVKSCDPLKLGNMSLNSLSWADDLVLLSTSPNGLQKCIDNLSMYCKKINININAKKTKCMIFGGNKKFYLTINDQCIERVDRYTYLGVTIHKSGKVDFAIKDRTERASRAINMIKAALSSNGNINVDIAMAIFQKQILPIITYGSIMWGMSESFELAYIEDIPEKVKSVSDLNRFMTLNSILKFKRVGRTGSKPRRIIATFDSYDSKLFAMNKLNNVTHFNKSALPLDFERFQCNFGKFVLNVNKFASSHGIRAELGIFPMNIYVDTKLVKYWHRLHFVEEESILKECFVLCKNNKHSWYNNIVNTLNRNGLGHFVKDPGKFSETHIGDELKRKLEDNYIQTWPEFSTNKPKLLYLKKIKQNNYTRSAYLNINDKDNEAKVVQKLKITNFLD